MIDVNLKLVITRSFLIGFDILLYRKIGGILLKSFTLEKDGFCGFFTEGKEHIDKAVIYMGGAEGNQKFALKASRFLIEQGYSVMVLGFFKWKGLPKGMYSIPVEYVERATNWLLSHSSGNIKKVAVMGTSTGAGYSLLCASLCSKISCVIAVSPFDFVIEGSGKGFSRMNRSVYTYRGNDISYSPIDILDKGTFALLYEIRHNKKYGIRRAMRYVYDMNPITPESRIMVENMKADVLLVAAQDDDCWPSDEAVRRIEDILSKAEYPYRVKAIIYKRASHLLGYIPKMKWTMNFVIKNALFAEKKYPNECQEARKNSTAIVLNFLREW